MTGISSRPAAVPDISSEEFRASARDVGEVISYLAGGVKPDPETLSRLLLSLRGIQGFLKQEAIEQANREEIHAHITPKGTKLRFLEEGLGAGVRGMRV
ncbi:hypothetical protein ACFSDD_21230 [Salipiger marinus]|uniref:hypothetical protein n=1 Tax=Salipiger marinus TaxID=555512 RepID=UPI002BAFD603|nr:hypothetical protein [Salipiger manganoxidans]MEB3417586.1 hypothetical protein [Salipiger manganoxidans]